MYSVTINSPFPIGILFAVGITEKNEIAIVWNEGPLLNQIRKMPATQLQPLRDRIISQIVASIDKRIPSRIIVY